MWSYIKRSASVIIRSFMMYKPLKFFGILGTIILLLGLQWVLGFNILFKWNWCRPYSVTDFISYFNFDGVQTFIVGLQADIIAQTGRF